jgi:hypothetical protein
VNTKDNANGRQQEPIWRVCVGVVSLSRHGSHQRGGSVFGVVQQSESEDKVMFG